ncbi:uncharacterized protein SPPG_09491 [Spizellomyces punctatus DAOM BR117]|uniref:Uncharacterized protein n=1 Tax=Spizellomyces punctatus (strain DAOM BR117) TaxID=645134 RepID=A0A0L0H6M6_SPIPD|nr:uncharacterized protein SPPG_09491 [Spizellomyces punctatus DAOM BR117]KNC96887.1 hypothetical protein SPPG_09491 [Spizellomyces punctatus DAOM BR117]|eukprot:XP_016604927.1 hypothetical protein SPPG_09491 [Spizellomyces punctatus DAOM BR117]
MAQETTVIEFSSVEFTRQSHPSPAAGCWTADNRLPSTPRSDSFPNHIGKSHVMYSDVIWSQASMKILDCCSTVGKQLLQLFRDIYPKSNMSQFPQRLSHHFPNSITLLPKLSVVENSGCSVLKAPMCSINIWRVHMNNDKPNIRASLNQLSAPHLKISRRYMYFGHLMFELNCEVLV